jgi:hypothetical protein
MTETTDTTQQEPYSTMEYGEELKGTIFPYVDNRDQWDIDFNDTKQSYEGSELPGWVLAGFAIYILWAIVYLIAAFT